MIESLNSLMDEHKRLCVNRHGRCVKGCALIVTQLINSPSDGWPAVNGWVSPATVAHLTVKPAIIEELNELIPGLNKEFSECAGFRTTILVKLDSATYLDSFQGGNSRHPDTAIRAHILKPDMRTEWMERLLKCVNFLKHRGHD